MNRKKTATAAVLAGVASIGGIVLSGALSADAQSPITLSDAVSASVDVGLPQMTVPPPFQVDAPFAGDQSITWTSFRVVAVHDGLRVGLARGRTGATCLLIDDTSQRRGGLYCGPGQSVQSGKFGFPARSGSVFVGVEPDDVATVVRAGRSHEVTNNVYVVSPYDADADRRSEVITRDGRRKAVDMLGPEP